MTQRRGLALLALCALGLGVSGCDEVGRPTPTPSPSPTPLSGIRGRVFIGPTCAVEGPIQSLGVDPSGDPAPEPSTVTSFDPDSTPEPPPSVDPDATPDPESTPYASSCVQPYVATLVITDSDGVATVRTSSAPDGSFEVTLAPGDYTVVPQNSDPFPVAQPVDVTVIPGGYADVQVNFDTGIR